MTPALPHSFGPSGKLEIYLEQEFAHLISSIIPNKNMIYLKFNIAIK